MIVGAKPWQDTVPIDKLLHTVIQAKAADLFITVGSPPAA